MPAGFPMGVDRGEELWEIEPASRWLLGDDGEDFRVLVAEGLKVLTDCCVFHAGDGVEERMGAPWRLRYGCRLGSPEDPYREQRVDEEYSGSVAWVVAVGFQN